MRLELDVDQVAVQTAIGAALKATDAERIREVWGSTFLRREYEVLGAMGMLALPLGDGTSMDDGRAVEGCILAEQLGRHVALTPTLSSVVQAAGIARPILGSDALAPVLEGSVVWAFADLEQGDQMFNPTKTLLTATPRGLRLRGSKTIVEWSSFAKELVVTCRLNGEVALILLSPSVRGLTARQHITSTGGELSNLTFDDVPVAEDAVLLTGAAAESALVAALRRTLLYQAAYLLGIGQRSLELTVAHTLTRHQFDRPLGAFQAVKQSLATSHIALACASLMVYEAAASSSEVPLSLLARTKAWVSEAVSDVLRVAHELHGGIGAVDDHEVSLLFRRGLGESHLYGSPSQLWRLASLQERLSEEMR